MALALSKKNIDVILTHNANKTAAGEVVAAIKANGQKSHSLTIRCSQYQNVFSLSTTSFKRIQQNWNTDKFDFLIKNAGVGATVPMAEVTEDIFDKLMNIHYKDVYFLT